MRMLRLIFFAAAALQVFCILPARGQEKVLTAGIQIKPIFESGLLKTGKQTITQNNVDFGVLLSGGLSAGMVVRKGISDLLAFESGINYTKRSYTLDITDHDAGFTGSTPFRIIAYEIPAALLVYIRLGEKTYMNASLGPCLDIFATDIFTYDTTYFEHYAVYNSRFRAAVIANMGMEFRTERSGFFYIGATYHRPFGDIYSQHIQYKANGKEEDVYTGISGNYLTLDIRYYFYTAPDKKKRKVPAE
jgi:hypothetical protein